MIDTHTHIYLPEFDSDRDEVVKNALEAGVTYMILPNVDCSTLQPMMSTHRMYPDITAIAVGLHPTEVNGLWRQNVDTCLSFDTKDAKNVAIGEIGIDMYWDQTYEKEQMEAFEYQCRKAQERDLPVIIHCREGLDQVLEVLQGFEYGSLQAVFHSFPGTPEDVERIQKIGDYYFGINGIVTFKNSKLKNTIPAIPCDRLLTETDAPYLAPVPHRGRRNEPAYVIDTGKCLAQILEMPFEEFDKMTTENAKRIFKL